MKGIEIADGASLVLPENAKGVIFKKVTVAITKKDSLKVDAFMKEDKIRRKIELQDQHRFEEQHRRYKKSVQNYSYQLRVIRKQFSDLEEEAILTTGEQEKSIRGLEEHIQDLENKHKKQLRELEDEAAEREEHIENLEKIISDLRQKNLVQY